MALAKAEWLVASDGFSAYGEGVFRWNYKIPPDAEKLRLICGHQGATACRFMKSKRLNDGVAQSVTYADGLLTVEEVWR